MLPPSIFSDCAVSSACKVFCCVLFAGTAGSVCISLLLDVLVSPSETISAEELFPQAVSANTIILDRINIKNRFIVSPLPIAQALIFIQRSNLFHFIRCKFKIKNIKIFLNMLFVMRAWNCNVSILQMPSQNHSRLCGNLFTTALRTLLLL